MLRFLFCILIIASFYYNAIADGGKGDTLSYIRKSTTEYLNKIDSIISAEQDKNYSLVMEEESGRNITNTNSKIAIEYRMELLDCETPMGLKYNPVVQKYINFYLTRKSDLVAKMVGTSKYYYPLFESKLDKYNLPLELKHLSIVESALNPLAKSRSGAIGLWQFMYNTGKMMGLDITSYVDERRDPYKATEAACQYLEYLYRVFGNWELALAAYNGGPGLVRNAIIKSGGKTDFWELRPYLPKQTQGYVPAFIAVNYIMNYYHKHEIIPEKPKFLFLKTDTIKIKMPVSFNVIADKLNIPISTVKFLNPQFKLNKIPRSVLPVNIVLPADKISEFLIKENSIYGYSNADKAIGYPIEKEKSHEIIHNVKHGEYLHLLAIKYKCSSEDIVKWNNLKNESIHSGQMLKIKIPASHKSRYNSQRIKTSSKADKFVYYTIQKGENLEYIANKISDFSLEELKKINNINEGDIISEGLKIKIGYK